MISSELLGLFGKGILPALRTSRPGSLAIPANLQVMTPLNQMAATEGHVQGVEVSIPSTPSDEMSTDVNQHELNLSTGNHRGGQNPFNIMSLNTTIMPPPQLQRNLEPNQFFEKMMETFSINIQRQAQEALRQQWHLLQQSAQVQEQAHQQQMEFAVQSERALNYTQHRQQLMHCENMMQQMSKDMTVRENQVCQAAELYRQAATEQMTQQVTEEREQMWHQEEMALAKERHRHSELTEQYQACLREYENSANQEVTPSDKFFNKAIMLTPRCKMRCKQNEIVEFEKKQH